MGGTLIARLLDPQRSGVYRAAQVRPIEEAVEGSGLRLARVVLGPGAAKTEMLAAFGRALDFPPWFGANWDALEDCLADLSWSDAAGHVILIEGAAGARAEDLGVLEDILAAAASYWAARARPFFAVFVAGPARLAPLYRERD